MTTGETGANAAPTPAPGAAPSIRLRIPAEPLQPFVTFFYFVETSGPLDDFLYPEWGNLRFGTGGEWLFRGGRYPAMPLVDAMLFGPTDRAAHITSLGGSTIGFGLTPLGWERLVGLRADTLANTVAPPGAILGECALAVRARIMATGDDTAVVAMLEALIAARLASRPANGAAAIEVDAALRTRPIDVAHFAALVGLSPKALSRVCRRVFGFGPKRLLRRQRFLDTLGQIRITDRPRFTSLIDPEYVDQAHFNREFREFMGLSPRAYLAAPRPLMAQAALTQLASGIPLSFKLPPPPC